MKPGKPVVVIFILLLSATIIAGCTLGVQPEGHWVIHGEKPAEKWEEALLTGNGNQGAMVWGITTNERITFVHEELLLPSWPRNKDFSVNTSELLPEVRKLIKQQKFSEAAQLACKEASLRQKKLGLEKERMLWGPTPHPAFDLVIERENTEQPKKYGRYLNLETGEASVHWSNSSGDFVQSSFSSRAHNVNVVQIKALAKSRLNLSLRLEETPGRTGKYLGLDLEKALKSASHAQTDQLYFHAAYDKDPGGYEGLARVTQKGGTGEVKDNSLKIKNAREVLIILKVNPLEDAINPERNKVWDEIIQYPEKYDRLLRPHATEHVKQFRSVTLDLGQGQNWAEPTEQMLSEAKTAGATPLFVEMAHAMGRYLFISSCGRYPPPLQGIWGGSWNPRWAGGFVFDSNVNLAISGGSVGNMHESMNSYFSFIERLLPAWRDNAKKYLGCRGFLVGHYIDPESGSLHSFNSKFPWMYWPGGAGWNIRPFYDHFLLTGDKDFLSRRVFPLYREMADFYEDYLTEGNDGFFEISPGLSPENTPGNSNSQLSFNTTFDIAVAREVFQVLINAGKELGANKEEIGRWQAIRDKLPTYLVNEDGALKEWATPLLDDNYNHRHTSHLYPLYPGFEFLEKETPGYLLDAAKVALEKRFQVNTTSAHGLIHIAFMAARTKDKAIIKGNMDRFAKGGYLYSNLATSHEPDGYIFNLDGIFSFPALVMESLVFSLPGEIELLPAWPADTYPSGSVKGVLARGGFSVDIQWENGRLASALIHSKNGGSCIIKYNGEATEIETRPGDVVSLDSNLQVLK